MKKLSLAVALVLASIGAHADPIVGLYSTGQGLSAGQQDTNYTLTITGNAGSSYGYVASNNVWPIGPWVSNTATSAWLTPLSNQSASFDPNSNGTYTWTTTFDLTGYSAATASLSGQFAADNSAVAYLNNNLIGTSNGFSSFSSLSAQSADFVSGVNTLSFVVTNWAQNGGNPTGIQAQLTSNISAVPEPTEGALLLSGLGLMGFIAVRRNKNV